MNWYEVWTHVLDEIEAQPEIAAVMGDAIFLDGQRAIEIPSMTCLFVTDEEDELFAPMQWQFDIYTRTLGEMVRVEKALRLLLHRNTYAAIGDVRMFAEFLDGRLLTGPERDPYFRRSLDFRLEPVRSRYYRPQAIGGS
jgi:hypothetical protein